MKQVLLTRGMVALVDDRDFERVSQHSWCAQSVGKPGEKKYYAASRIDSRLVLLHRFILEASPTEQVDHRDGNPFDCQRHNIRKATPQQNAANMRKSTSRKMSSKFKGVCKVSPRCNATNPWLAYIGTVATTEARTPRKYLGYFPTEVEAAKAYDVAALRLWGDFSNLNFPL